MPTPSEQLLSRTIYDVDGTTTVWNFSFTGGYLDPAHVKAYTELPTGVRTPIVVTPEMLIGEFQLQIAPALPSSAGVLVIYRDTPKDLPLVDFVEGPLSEIALDTNAKQAVFIAAEAQDTINTSNLQAAIDAQVAAQVAAEQANIDANTAASAASAAGSSAIIASNAAAVAQAFAGADGSSLVGYTPAGAGAVVADVQSKLRESVSVKDFGAVGDGSVNDTLAFQIAANYATTKARDYMTGPFTVLKAPVAHIKVPEGNYILSSAITSPAQIVWNLDANAVISSPDLLGGVINRGGRHINARHTGYIENSTTLSLRANQQLGSTGGVYGITSLDQISQVGPPHSVTLQIDNDTRANPTLTGTTYTATSVTYTNSPNLSDLKIGSFITTQGSPQYVGQVTAVDIGSKTITVGGMWRPFTGASGATGTPVNGVDAVVDYYRKLWGQNTNVFLRSGNPTTRITGYEMGVVNQQSDSPVLNLADDQTPSVWGFDAVNLGSFKAGVAFVARAGVQNWRTGFASLGNEIGFQVFPKSGSTSTVGFSYEVETGTALRCASGAKGITYQINADGTMEMGSKTVAGAPFIDFNSSGNNFDYDARILATGGSGAAGQGELRHYARFHRFYGYVGGAGGEAFTVAAVADSVNYVQASGAVTGGSGPIIQAQGFDANIDLRLSPKGTGSIRFGTWTGSSDVAINGFVTIKDVNGTIRKLATIA